MLRYQGRLCVPDVDNLRIKILEESYDPQYAIYPDVTKIYCDLREVYWWDGLKRDIEEFVARCPNCQQIKVEHLKTSGLTKVMDKPTWKWEEINIDFIVGLPRT